MQRTNVSSTKAASDGKHPPQQPELLGLEQSQSHTLLDGLNLTFTIRELMDVRFQSTTWSIPLLQALSTAAPYKFALYFMLQL